jgi:hypothetical protein
LKINRAHAGALRDLERAQRRLHIAALDLQRKEEQHLRAQNYYNERYAAVRRAVDALAEFEDGQRD